MFLLNFITTCSFVLVNIILEYLRCWFFTSRGTSNGLSCLVRDGTQDRCGPQKMAGQSRQLPWHPRVVYSTVLASYCSELGCTVTLQNLVDCGALWKLINNVWKFWKGAYAPGCCLQHWTRPLVFVWVWVYGCSLCRTIGITRGRSASRWWKTQRKRAEWHCLTLVSSVNSCEHTKLWGRSFDFLTHY